jgi:hypothetical protein
MIETMIETDLTIKDFTKYFETHKLGKLSFPNGQCYTPPEFRSLLFGKAFEAGEITDFHINLNDLYKLASGWKINKTEVPLDDIIGIIAFGSAVKYPGYEEVIKTSKKYFLFGPDTTKIKQVPIQPKDVDFLVITNKDLTRNKVLEPVSLDTYDCGTWIKEGGIHLVSRGIEQVINGVKSNDTVSISALQQGVPIFYNKAQLEEIRNKTGIRKQTPRKIKWDEDKNNNLVGKII